MLATPEAVTGCIGAEMSIQAIGLDHPTGNLGYGVRRILDVLSKNLSGADAEIGVGVAIRKDPGAGNSTFRYGLAIYDEPREHKPNRYGHIYSDGRRLRLHSVVGHTGADILLERNSLRGVQLNGDYTAGVIVLKAGNQVDFDSLGDHAAVDFNTPTTRLCISRGGVERVAFGLGATPGLYIANDLSIAPRDTGCATWTGAGDETTGLDPSTVTLQQLAARVVQIESTLTFIHGLIGLDAIGKRPC